MDNKTLPCDNHKHVALSIIKQLIHVLFKQTAYQVLAKKTVFQTVKISVISLVNEINREKRGFIFKD